MSVQKLSLIAVIVFFGCSAAVAQNELVRPDQAAGQGAMSALETPEEDAGQNTIDPRAELWRKTVWVLVPFLAVFTLLLMFGLFWTMWFHQDSMTDNYFKAYTLTLIIFSGLFLIVTGWNREQLAPMMGLLGTLAGYILGDRRSREEERQKSAEDVSTASET